MSVKPIFLAALISLAGTAAIAQTELELQNVAPKQKAALSRAEVRAEVKRAMANGELTTPSEVLATRIEPKDTALAQSRRPKASAEAGR